MKLIVNPHKIEIVKELVNEKEIDITKCEFEFSEEITDDFVKEAYFTLNNETYKQIIENNECKIPYEVLKEKGQVEIGCVAFLVENEQEIKRYNPSPVYISTLVGSLKEEYENSEPITPTDKEQIEQMLNNINVDANKQGKITTITITFKDGTTKDVTLEDGMGIDYNWVGTQLGIKREDEQEYEYVDLKGEKGDAGAIKMRIVQELPFVGEDDTIYLLPLEEPETEDNRYAEYIYVNNQWELLGKIGIQVDLSDYYTKSQVYDKEETDTKVNAKYTKPSDGIPKEDLTQSVQTSLDKADSSIQDVSSKEDKSNKVTSLSSSSTDIQYPSAKCVYDSQEAQDTNIQDLQEGNNELKGILNNIYDIDNYLINNHSIESEETTESITLNNTMNKAPMSLTLKGNIEQDSTTGKNLLKLKDTTNGGLTTKVNDDGSISVSGTSTSTSAYLDTGEMTNIPIGTYTLSIQSPLSVNLRIFLLNNNTQFATATISAGQTSTSITTEQIITSYSALLYGLTTNTSYNFKIYPMLESGSTATDFEPFTNGASPNPSYPQDIHIVSGDNEIKVQNKNLWNIGDITNVGWSTINNDTKNLLNTLKEGTYTLTVNYKVKSIEKVSSDNKCGFYITNSNGGAIIKRKCETSLSVGDIVNYVNTITITSAMVGNFTNFYFYGFGNDGVGKTATSDIINSQLEYGSTATDYVPHQEYTKEINLGELEVGGIGEYEDEFFKNTIDSEYYDSTLELDKWYLKKRIGKYNVNTSQIVLESSYSNLEYAKIPKPSDYVGYNAYGNNPIYYSHALFSINSGSWNKIANIGNIYSGAEKYTFYLGFEKGTDLETIQSKLVGSYLYYPLATPENILLNDTLQETLDSFVSYQEQTNISQENNDLPFVIKARAIKEIL